MNTAKHLERIAALHANGLTANAARSLSALIRSALSDRVRAPLVAFAVKNPAILNHPEFII